jgi:hypothetical protein
LKKQKKEYGFLNADPRDFIIQVNIQKANIHTEGDAVSKSYYLKDGKWWCQTDQMLHGPGSQETIGNRRLGAAKNAVQDAWISLLDAFFMLVPVDQLPVLTLDPPVGDDESSDGELN